MIVKKVTIAFVVVTFLYTNLVFVSNSFGFFLILHY